MKNEGSVTWCKHIAVGVVKSLMEHDRHLQKSGLKDIRGNPKKDGAGKANWGSIEQEIKDGKEKK